ncbi:hypothetical protein [Helicobacter pylori]|nr:hypothetical protein [Helicobacter pylori]
MIKKCLKLRVKRPNPFNGSSFLKQIDNHNIVTTASLTLNGGAFL